MAKKATDHWLMDNPKAFQRLLLALHQAKSVRLYKLDLKTGKITMAMAVKANKGKVK